MQLTLNIKSLTGHFNNTKHNLSNTILKTLLLLLLLYICNVKLKISNKNSHLYIYYINRTIFEKKSSTYFI